MQDLLAEQGLTEPKQIPKKKSQASWAQQVADATAQDKREQPWKAALGETHNQGAEGEDWINLQLPNHVQCGSMAA
jgi:hypothetical protein